ncbi:patellin-2-like [Phragmites australis]|uniref:patellin-2-like n=1 Tax=Phragmites australis TaxID=29695 RepID=UPI002D79CAA3|nr:patellin-2-like [Phragmites australis]
MTPSFAGEKLWCVWPTLWRGWQGQNVGGEKLWRGRAARGWSVSRVASTSLFHFSLSTSISRSKFPRTPSRSVAFSTRAEETKQESAAAAPEVVVTEAEKKADEPAPAEEKKADEPEPAEEKTVEVEEKAVEAEKKADDDSEEEEKADEAEEPVAADEVAVTDGTGSFKEESNLVSELPDPERMELAQYKELIAAALANEKFDLPPPPTPPAQPAAAPSTEETKPEEPAKEEAKDEASGLAPRCAAPLRRDR